MQTQDIRQLAEWLALTDIDFLELRGPDIEVRIHRDSAAKIDAEPGDERDNPPATAQDQAAVCAPSVGLLLDRLPGRPQPLCAPGAAVQSGSLLALLQVGALLLPVRAPCNGWTGDWLVPPGSTVGYGAHLLNIAIEHAAPAAAQS